jgi:hypothetical protein
LQADVKLFDFRMFGFLPGSADIPVGRVADFLTGICIQQKILRERSQSLLNALGMNKNKTIKKL